MPDAIIGGSVDVPAGGLGVRDFVQKALEAALGTQITDAGGGMGSVDLWFTWEGQEWFLQVRPSGEAKAGTATFPAGTTVHFRGIPCELLHDTPIYTATPLEALNAAS